MEGILDNSTNLFLVSVEIKEKGLFCAFYPASLPAKPLVVPWALIRNLISPGT